MHSIKAERVRPLRKVILSDGHSDSFCFSGDDDESTLHLAIYDDEKTVAVATLCRGALPAVCPRPVRGHAIL
jgi:hypothetical protein